MMFNGIGVVIGALILVAGIYYFVKDRNDLESRKVYSIISGIGGIVFIGMLIKLLTELP